MKRNPILENIRKNISAEIKAEIDLSFEIADRICEILKKQGKTQRELANTLGKKESEISKWLRGTHNFTTQTLARISAILGEPVIEVTGRPKKTEKEYIFVEIHQNQSYTFSAKQCNEAEIVSTNMWKISPYRHKKSLSAYN